jgi:hypothetical protein
MNFSTGKQWKVILWPWRACFSSKIKLNALNPWEWVLIEQLMVAQLFLWDMVINEATCWRHRRAEQLWNVSVLQTVHLTNFVIVSSHLILGLQSGLPPSGFPINNILYQFLIFSTSYMPRPPNPSWFYKRNNNLRIKIMKLLNTRCSPVSRASNVLHFRSKILVSTLFSNTLNLVLTDTA